MTTSKGKIRNTLISTAIASVCALMHSTAAVADLASEQAALQQIFDATNGGSSIAVAVSGDSIAGLSLGVRELDGELPDIFAELPSLNQIDFRKNKLKGKLPDSIGSLDLLQKIEVQENAFVGDATAALKPMLDRSGVVDVRYNGLYFADEALNSLITGFPDTQTLDARVVDIGDVQKTSAVVTWSKVGFTEAGGYLIEFTDLDGNTVSREVQGKNTLQTEVVGLTPGVTYSVVVRSFTKPHTNNENRVLSDGNLFPASEITTEDNDSDGDGIGDKAEGMDEQPPTDTDDDGIPDFQDDDDDNDGIKTAEEADGDTDGDGVSDYLDNDDDGDGILTADELPGDSDGDGITDALDDDDDGDGVKTVDEFAGDTDEDGTVDYLDTDDDGDGTPTTNERPFDKDENEDGIPDYLDAASPATVVLADVDEREVGTVITSKSGGGSLGFGFMLISLLGLAKKRHVIKSRIFPSALALLVLSLSANVVSADEENKDRKGRTYIGLNAGTSELEPDPSQSRVPISISDNEDVGAKLVLGYEMSNRFAIEGFYGLLGEAEVTPSGKIDYEVGGVALVFNPLGRAGGFSPLFKLGVNRIDNTGRNVNFQREEDLLGYGAIGLEYEFSNAVALRGEYDYFSEDAQMLSLGLVKKFGPRAKAPVAVNVPPATPTTVNVEPKVIIKTIEVPVPAPAPVIQPAPAPIIQIPDSDGDGISDVGDKCPNSPAGASIDNMGCAVFQGNLKGVNFETNSAKLTRSARVSLDNVATALQQFPGLKVEVQAHTDSVGSATYNQRLSAKRAKSVIGYLSSKGISSSRMIPVGYGERTPIASNLNEAGRAQNRRVVFVVR